ncbi:MAG: GGDEF domain-containing protein [Lachnospiraceae bacterium]|nr:GGDEF domain-containing protein [Candidatus Colinaster scatohippi]
MGKKKKNNLNKGIVAQWGVTAVILFVVVMIMVSKFSVSNKETATANTYKTLTTESSLNAVKVGTKLINLIRAGEGAVSEIETDSDFGDAEKRACAVNLSSKIKDVYLVLVADKEGKAITSIGTEVDISKRDYFYNGSVNQLCYTPNDGIMQRSGYVAIIPYHQLGVIAGNIYLFADSSEIHSSLSRDDYGGGVAFALMTANGDIISRTGNNSYFTSEGNLFTNLSTATLSELSLSQVKLRAEKKNKMAFVANKGDETRTVCIAPIGVSDWQLIVAINQKYVNTVLRSATSAGRKLVIELAISICLFVVILVAMVIISKFQYGEENKDLADKADTDLLTSLNNKIATERKIQEFMDENPDSQCLMFLFDIDNFKKINDTMGHAFGDEVLRTLGHSLTNEFRVTDIMGRLGGDEFVLFLKNIKSDEQLEREGVRITNFFHQFKAGDYVKYSATASIGAVVFPRDATDFQSAYQAADKALYEAKRRGKNQLVFYDSNMQDVKSVRVTDDIDPVEETK